MTNSVSTLKPDSDATLYEGMGAPYLAIFDGGQEAIIDPVSKLPIGVYVVSFEYTYEEGKEDKGRFIIVTNNTNLISLKEFNYMMPLHLQWGWIYPDATSKSGPLKKVLITGHDVHFTPEGTRITIEFSDCSILLKNMQPNFAGQAKGFDKYVTSVLNGIPVGITFIDYDITREVREQVVAKRVIPSGQVVGNSTPGPYYQSYYNDFGKGPGQAVYPYTQDGFIPQVYYTSQVPYMSDPDQVGVKILEATPENQQLTKDLPNDYKLIDIIQHKATNVLLLGTPRNRFQQVQQLANRLKKGPYYINGSGGKLTVENQRLNRPVSKTYTYAGGNGELLEFTVKSKFTKTSVEIGKTSDIDPNDKKAKTTTTQIGIDQNSESADLYMHWWSSWGNPANPTTGFDNRYPYSLQPQDRYSNYPVIKDDGKFTPNLVEQKKINNLEKTTSQVPIEADDLPIYNSREDALVATAANVKLSKEEYKAFIDNLKQEFEKKTKNPKSGEETAEAVSFMNTLSNYTVTRKVTIKKKVNPIDYDPLKATNNVGSTYNQNTAYGVYGQDLPRIQWQRGYDYLKNQKGITILETNIEVNKHIPEKNTVTLLEEIELEIPINGARTLASDYTEYADLFMGNDIEEVVRNQLTATAVFVGDPFLEKSQNLEIQNISDKYSGVWYIKSVTHQFDTGSGYLCNVKFIKKDTVVSKNVIKASMAMMNAMANINKVAKEVYDSTGQDRTSILQEALEEYANQHPGYSILAKYNDQTNTVDIYKAEQDFNIMTKNPSTKNDTKTLQEKGTLVGSIDLNQNKQ